MSITVEVVCSKDGQTVKKSVNGAVGKQCLTATQFIEDALNMKDTERTMTAESLHQDTDEGNLLTA